jgi:putative SOS response-associated peptidase YedK
MALAGLWDTWRSPAGERIRRFTIITTPPNELCAALHNRMPAVLKPGVWPLWLGEQPAELAQVKALLAPYPSDGMIAWPISARRQRQGGRAGSRRLIQKLRKSVTRIWT